MPQMMKRDNILLHKLNNKGVDQGIIDPHKQSVRCSRKHKIAERKGDKIEIKCNSCGEVVKV